MSRFSSWPVLSDIYLQRLEDASGNGDNQISFLNREYYFAYSLYPTHDDLDVKKQLEKCLPDGIDAIANPFYLKDTLIAWDIYTTDPNLSSSDLL